MKVIEPLPPTPTQFLIDVHYQPFAIMKKKANLSSIQPLAALLVPQVLDSRSKPSLREWDALAKQKAQCFCKPEPLEMGLFFAQSGVRKLKATSKNSTFTY